LTRRTDFSSWSRHADLDGYNPNDIIASIESAATAAINSIHTAGVAARHSDPSSLPSITTAGDTGHAGSSAGAGTSVDTGNERNLAFSSDAGNPAGATSTMSAGSGAVTSANAGGAAQTLVVPAGGTVELTTPFSGVVSFAGSTGTLEIDNAASFTGKIAGQLAIGDVIDFANVTAGANAKISYSGNNSPGTLTVSDGTHTASVALSGNYSLANFTASSDGHGGTAVVDPPALPAGVTLQQIDGGPTYYASNGLTYAVNAGWDNPNFIPIGAWYGMLTQQSDATRWHDLDWNTAFRVTSNTNLSLLKANGLDAIVSPGEYTGTPGSETVGLLSADEPSTFAEGVTQPLSSTANSLQDGRLWYINNTWNFVNYGGLSGVNSSAQVLSSLVTTPDGTKAHLDTSSVDLYWFTGAHDSTWQYVGGLLDNLGRSMTPDEMARGSNYGDLISEERSYTGGNSPLYAIVEDGGPYTIDTSASTYITPPELNWAVWSSLIHGARGVVYFNHTFAGPAQSDDNLADPFFQTVQPGQTVSMYTQVKQTDALVEQMAPVLNSPTALNYVSVNTPGYQNGVVVSQFSGIEVTAKDYNGQFYIFADTRDSMTQNNISATFTIADKNATSVTVVNENRTIAVVNGVFADTFATAATVHIYQVNDGTSSGSTPTPPPAPTISAFSPDTGVAGDGITDANKLTLTGNADPNSTITVYDGSTKLGTATASSTGSWDYITTVLTDAKHVLTATETNSSGQISAASAALTVTVDTHVPAAPVLATDAVVNTNQVKLSGTAEANSTITVYDGATVVGTGTTNSTGNFTVTTSALSSGTHALTATATDVAGNISAVSQPLDPVIPSSTPTPPAAPTIALLSQDTGVAGDHFTSDNTPTLSGTAVANSTVNVFDGKTQIGTAAVDASGHWSLTTTAPLTDGTHSLTATDISSGQSSAASAAFSVTIDTHAPAAPVLATDAVVNTNEVNLSGTAEANSTITIYDGATVVGTGTTSSTGNFTVTTSALSSGAHALTATATDVAGNVSAMSQPLDPVIPSSTPTPPAAPTIALFSQDTGVVGDHITSDNTPMLSGTAVANSTVDVFDGKTQIGAAAVDAGGHWSLTTPALSDGTHSLTATDISSGQTSAASAAFSVTIDTHAPAAPTMAAYSQGGSAVGSSTALTDLVLKGSAEAGSTIDIFDSGKQIGTVTTSTGSWSFDTGSLANGSHSFTATAIDAAGTSSHASAADVVSVTSSTPSTPPPAAPTSIEFTNVSYIPWNHTATIKGTADAYSQVKLYDGTTLIGTVTASAKGTWSLTDSQLSNTLHTITAQEVNSSGHVIATSSGSAMLMASNTSTLTGTGGDDLMFSSSSQVNDTFVFAANFGHSAIEGFSVSGPGHDTVQFSKNTFDSFASVLSHATQVGQDVVIASGNDTLKLLNTKLSTLNSQDFHFA
jgi:hypothetical protein